MKSQLVTALGISSILLGLYILTVYIINVSQKPNYHIGCYLSNPVFDNSLNFKQRIKKLQSQSIFKRKLDQKVRTNQLIDHELHKKSVDLARSVEQYIKKLSLVKRYQLTNMQFFTELSLSQSNYETCSKKLAQNFNSQQCKSLWSEYNECFNKYNNQKNDLQRLYNKRSDYLRQIDDLIEYDPSKNNAYDLQAELKKLKQKYDRMNGQIDKNKQRFVSELKRVQQRNQSKSNQYDQIERQVNRTKYEYQICLKNQKQFNKCEEIKRTIKEYGYSQSVQTLEERIRSKREVLMEMLKLLSQSKDNREIRELYNKREQQLKHLMRLRIDIKFDQTRECGCTEEQRTALQKQYQTSKIKLSQIIKQLRQFTLKVQQLETNIKQTDKERQKLINGFRQQTERLTRQNKNDGYSLKQRLEVYTTNLNKVNDQINVYSNRLNSLEFQCNQYKNRLSGKLLQSNEITTCLSKKNFYNQLKAKAKQILKKDDSTSEQHKKNILSVFSSIQYPKPFAIQSLRDQLQQLQNLPKQVSIQTTTKQVETTNTNEYNEQNLSPQTIIQKVIEQYAVPTENGQQQTSDIQITQKTHEFSESSEKQQGIDVEVHLSKNIHIIKNQNQQFAQIQEKVTVDVIQL